MKYIIIILILFSTACSRGVWTSSDTYRPKKQNFSLTGQSFKSNALLSTNRLYRATKPFLNYDGKVFISFMGFYGDGKLIFSSTEQNQLLAVAEKNSLESASTIGRYTTDQQKISVELFLPMDGGTYNRVEGIIKKDSIILFRRISTLFKRETRADTLVKSNFAFR